MRWASNSHDGDLLRQFSGSLCTAIDALLTAQRYGATRGMTLAFNEEDVRAVATAIFIQTSKGRAA